MLTRKDKLALAGIAPPDDLTPIVPAVADDAPMPLRPEPLEKPDFMTPTVVDLHTPKPAWMVAAGLVVLPARTYADRVARCRQSLIDGIMLDAAAEWAAGRTVEGDELASIADGMARQWRLCVTFGPEVAS